MAKKSTDKPTMTPITADDPGAKSADVVAANLEKLKALFPEAVSEDGVNVDVLNQLIGKAVTDAEEKYGLNWHGKRRARQMALTPSTGTLRPCPEESVAWDTTQNLFIEGDNLEVLKLLQKSYANKVKLIYIDPPYNQDADVIYQDDFSDNIRNYQMLTGQIESDGRRLTSGTESAGRHHTNWLNMMYPRLRVARGLLRPDGLIFVSVDDNEVAALRSMLSEIFGEENFEGHIHWRRRHNQPNDATKMIGLVAEHILCYAKDKVAYKAAGVGKIALTGNFSNPDNDPRGDWASKPWKVGSGQSGTRYTITTPSGDIYDEEWMGERKTFEALLADTRIVFPNGGNGAPRKKYFRSERETEGQCATNWWSHEQFGHNQAANSLMEKLMGEKNVFSNPKPLELIGGILDVSNTQASDIVLDFFAGSGTTAHATIARNFSDSGHRRFILVQLPEPLEIDGKEQEKAAGYCDRIGRPRNIAELTKERLRRAGQDASEANPLFNGDVGFRVFKLDTSNIRAWNPDPDDLEGTLHKHTEHLAAGRSEADVLYELLLKLGLDLAVPTETRQVDGKDVHAVGAGTLFACLAESLSRDDVESIAQAIIDWHKELAPEGETTIVFRDSGFADDVAKSNLAAILVQAGFDGTRIRSL